MKIRRLLPLLPYLGHRLWRKTLQHKVLFSLLGFNSLMYIANSTFGAYIAAYYRSYGISMGQIGVLTAIGPMVTVAAQPTWGVVSDKTGRHMAVLRIALTGSICAMLTYYIAGGFWGFAFSAGLFSLFACGIQPLADTVTVHRATEHGYRFSAIRLGGSAGYALCVVLAGRILRENPSASFGITSAIYLVMLSVSFTVPKAADPAVARKKLEPARLFRNRKILFIILFVFVFQTALGFYSSFLGVYVTELGYDTATIGWLMFLAALGELPVLMAIDWALKRFRTEALLVAAGLIMGLRMLAPLTGSIGWLAFSQCFQGVTYMVMYYSTVMFMNNNLEPELRGTGMAVLCVVQGGCASLFSNIVGGQVADAFGMRAAYLAYAILLFVFNGGCAVWFIARSRRRTA